MSGSTHLQPDTDDASPVHFPPRGLLEHAPATLHAASKADEVDVWVGNGVGCECR